MLAKNFFITNNHNIQEINIDLVIIYFGATWCPPCQKFKYIFEEVSEKFPNIKFFKCDVDEMGVLATQYKIQALPTIIFLNNSQIVDKKTGCLPVDIFENICNDFLQSNSNNKTI